MKVTVELGQGEIMALIAAINLVENEGYELTGVEKQLRTRLAVLLATTKWVDDGPA